MMRIIEQVEPFDPLSYQTKLLGVLNITKVSFLITIQLVETLFALFHLGILTNSFRAFTGKGETLLRTHPPITIEPHRFTDRNPIFPETQEWRRFTELRDRFKPFQ